MHVRTIWTRLERSWILCGITVIYDEERVDRHVREEGLRSAKGAPDGPTKARGENSKSLVNSRSFGLGCRFRCSRFERLLLGDFVVPRPNLSSEYYTQTVCYLRANVGLYIPQIQFAGDDHILCTNCRYGIYTLRWFCASIVTRELCSRNIRFLGCSAFSMCFVQMGFHIANKFPVCTSFLVFF